MKSALKDEIHEYIDQADNRFLSLVYGMIQADQREEDYKLSDDEISFMEERLQDYKRNPDSGAIWNEVKSRIQNK